MRGPWSGVPPSPSRWSRAKAAGAGSGARIGAIGRPATWHADIDGVPAGPCIVLANEFLDALPVRQFLRDPDGWRERRVGLAEGRFVFMLGPVVQDPPLEPAHLAGAAPGDVAEVPEAAHEIVRRLATRLLRHGGAALFVDYGPQASGTGDTLQAVSRHRHADPLADPGAVDLTAHVDFAALACGASATSTPAVTSAPSVAAIRLATGATWVRVG